MKSSFRFFVLLSAMFLVTGISDAQPSFNITVFKNAPTIYKPPIMYKPTIIWKQPVPINFTGPFGESPWRPSPQNSPAKTSVEGLPPADPVGGTDSTSELVGGAPLGTTVEVLETEKSEGSLYSAKVKMERVPAEEDTAPTIVNIKKCLAERTKEDWVLAHLTKFSALSNVFSAPLPIPKHVPL